MDGKETMRLQSQRKLNLKSRVEKRKPREDTLGEEQPEVIVDFEYENGFLFIVIENIGPNSAYDVSEKFDKPISSMQKKKISSLNIFKSLRFLPPRKKIRIFVDSYQSYIYNRQPLTIKVNIQFKNKTGKRFKNSILHDLSIYKDLIEMDSALSKTKQVID
jgi:hypothetical protein